MLRLNMIDALWLVLSFTHLLHTMISRLILGIFFLFVLNNYKDVTKSNTYMVNCEIWHLVGMYLTFVQRRTLDTIWLFSCYFRPYTYRGMQLFRVVLNSPSNDCIRFKYGKTDNFPIQNSPTYDVGVRGRGYIFPVYILWHCKFCLLLR